MNKPTIVSDRTIRIITVALLGNGDLSEAEARERAEAELGENGHWHGCSFDILDTERISYNRVAVRYEVY